jgi:hypothetical protein
MKLERSSIINWKLLREMENPCPLYWYALSKNSEYISDFNLIRTKILSYLRLVDATLIKGNDTTPLILDLTTPPDFDDYNFSSIDSHEETVEDFKCAISTYYDFIKKWKIIPFNYIHDNAFAQGEIEILHDYTVPKELDLSSSLIENIEPLALSIDPVIDEVATVKQKIDSKFNEVKPKVKIRDFEMALRAIEVFDNAYKQEFLNQENLSYEQFLNTFNVTNEEISPTIFFNKENHKDFEWEEVIKNVYPKYGVSYNLNVTSNQDFKRAIGLISRPLQLLDL